MTLVLMAAVVSSISTLSFRTDADRNASHPDVAHYVRSLQQRFTEGAAAGVADSGEAVSSSR